MTRTNYGATTTRTSASSTASIRRSALRAQRRIVDHPAVPGAGLRIRLDHDPERGERRNYINTIPNFALKPETTVAYDLGFDQRLHDGGVLSFDLYDDTVHDVFLANTTTLPSIAGICGPGQNAAFPNALCLQTNQINGPIERGYGVESQCTKNPTIGWGYYVSASAQPHRSRSVAAEHLLREHDPDDPTGNFNVNGAQLFGYPFFKATASCSTAILAATSSRSARTTRA